MDQSSSIGGSEGGFLHPERIVSYFGLKSGMSVADFGAGHGHFTIPMARLVGQEGKIYALDIQKNTLEVVRAKAKLEHLLNIETIWADIELPQGSKLPDASLDLVLAANIMFQAEVKDAIINEAKRVLKSGGKLALIEWDETPFPGGPSNDLKFSKEMAKKLAGSVGFEIDREFEAGSHHYGLVFRKT